MLIVQSAAKSMAESSDFPGERSVFEEEIHEVCGVMLK
jgi:hypothetical protein